MAEQPVVGIIMGSKSDMPAMEACTKELDELGVPYELVIASAHRAPAKVHEWASTAADRGIKVIIAAAGKAAHLAGAMAANTLLPVIGVPLLFISYGGTSLLVNFLCLGLILSVYRREAEREIRELRAQAGLPPEEIDGLRVVTRRPRP